MPSGSASDEAVKAVVAAVIDELDRRDASSVPKTVAGLEEFTDVIVGLHFEVRRIVSVAVDRIIKAGGGS